jgi:hypothetical protein
MKLNSNVPDIAFIEDTIELIKRELAKIKRELAKMKKLTDGPQSKKITWH